MGATASSETLTPRLRCRRPEPTEADAERYRTLLLDPSVQHWLRPAPLQPMRAQNARDVLERDLTHWTDHGFGPWVLLDRATGALVGRAGPSWTTAPGSFAVELAWALLPDRWGTGLATEAAGAGLAAVRAEGIDEIVSFTIPTNLASRRVMEKTGLRYERTFEHVGLEHVLYRLPSTRPMRRPSRTPRPAGA